MIFKKVISSLNEDVEKPALIAKAYELRLVNNSETETLNYEVAS